MNVDSPVGLTDRLLAAVRPYFQPGPLGALALGISSGFPFAMIGATLTTRLADAGIEKKAVTAFALTLLIYNLKFLWAPIIDTGRVPFLAKAIGQRRAWLLVAGVGVMAAVAWLGLTDPSASLGPVIAAAMAVAFAGATYDIVIDAFRIESLTPEQLGVGSGMSQYGWRIGAAAAGALALVVASRGGWSLAYLAATMFALPALFAGWLLGEPRRHREIKASTLKGFAAAKQAVIAPLADFVKRDGAWLALLFILLHKLGDTVANLSLRLLFKDLGFSKDEIAAYDVGGRLCRDAAGHLCRRRAVQGAGSQARRAGQPDPDGGVEHQFRRTGLDRAQQRRAGRARR